MKHGLLPRTRLNIPSKSSFIDFSDGFQQCLRYCCCVKSRVLKSVRRLWQTWCHPKIHECAG
jgi:hypothetical protein